MNTEQLLTWLGHIANIVAVIGIPWVTYKATRNYKLAKQEKQRREAEEKRLNEGIEMVLVEKDGPRIIYFPADIRRALFTRAEVQGRLSVRGHERYDLSYLNTKECLEKIDHLYVSSGKDNCRLEIPCDKQEIEKFPPERLQPLGFTLVGFDS